MFAQRPGHRAVGPGFLFLFVDRLAGAHHPLLIFVGLPRVLLGEEIRVRFADRVFCVVETKLLEVRAVTAQKAAVAVFGKKAGTRFRAGHPLAGKETARPEHLRQFVLNALVLQLVLARNSGLVQLFADLRYELKSETRADLRGLSRAERAAALLDLWGPAGVREP